MMTALKNDRVYFRFGRMYFLWFDARVNVSFHFLYAINFVYFKVLTWFTFIWNTATRSYYTKRVICKAINRNDSSNDLMAAISLYIFNVFFIHLYFFLLLFTLQICRLGFVFYYTRHKSNSHKTGIFDLK